MPRQANALWFFKKMPAIWLALMLSAGCADGGSALVQALGLGYKVVENVDLSPRRVAFDHAAKRCPVSRGGVAQTVFDHTAKHHLQESHCLATGKGVTIAVVGTGLDPANPFIQGNIRGGVNLSGVGPEKDLEDRQGLGTAVAGLAAGQMGAAPEAGILAVKVWSQTWRSPAATARGVGWAISHGAQIVVLAGNVKPSLPERWRALLSRALAAGALIIAPAGDQGQDLCRAPARHPASLAAPALLKVTGLSFRRDALTPGANFCPAKVDLAIWGGGDEKRIETLWAYRAMNRPWPAGGAARPPDHLADADWIIRKEGSALAAGLAAGVAALVWQSLPPNLSRPAQARAVREILLRSGRPAPALSGRVKSGRALDALDAVRETPAYLGLTAAEKPGPPQ